MKNSSCTTRTTSLPLERYLCGTTWQCIAVRLNFEAYSCKGLYKPNDMKDHVKAVVASTKQSSFAAIRLENEEKGLQNSDEHVINNLTHVSQVVEFKGVCYIDSVLSQFSSVSRRKPDYARRCILALLIHAVFIMAVFLAFFIGHWISEQNERNSTVTEELFFILTPSPPINPPAKALVIEDVPTLLTTPAKKNSVTRNPGSLTTPKIIERLIPLPSRTNFTMEYVHPPSFESYEFLEELHSAHRGHGRTDSLLVPLPLHILPIHYDILLDLTRFSDEKFIRGNLTVHLESYGNSTDDEILFHVKPNTIHIYLLKPNSSQRVSSFTTKFEPALARSFLPCWDEPGIKRIQEDNEATFNISVLHQSRFIVLSNMPPDSGRPRRDLRGKRTVITQFQETPPMSSYLLAFAVGWFNA
uniref:Peptidase_M1_N domain-containing protein n=1 Tax=Heterorhabditis bacteriophora TaxID=37862 RepID=A0A1I7XDG5_HETBA